jgi:hypothetical protein
LTEHTKEISNIKRKGKGHATTPALLNLVARNLARHVIVLSLSVIRQDLVGLLDLLEHLHIASLVRMVLQGGPLIGPFDIGSRGRPL